MAHDRHEFQLMFGHISDWSHFSSLSPFTLDIQDKEEVADMLFKANMPEENRDVIREAGWIPL